MVITVLKSHMNRFVLKNTSINIYIYHFLINIFIKKESLHFGDRVAILNDFLCEYGGSRCYYSFLQCKLNLKKITDINFRN